ncbi:Hypothetical predicted protein [Cloeon dipterum]|uniref:Uncharacterized protein n=1 Tax=Cloeon dipterum TaxID=197152 RepID=A0A8S1DSM5_9INSE|nr:Hypothetical predicted protein [Cloeon dipterum]
MAVRNSRHLPLPLIGGSHLITKPVFLVRFASQLTGPPRLSERPSLKNIVRQEVCCGINRIMPSAPLVGWWRA